MKTRFCQIKSACNWLAKGVFPLFLLGHIPLLLAKNHWFFELFSHYLHYYALAALFLMLLNAALKRFKTALILSLILALHLTQLSPYLEAPNLKKTSTSTTQTLLSQNVYYLNPNTDEFLTMLDKHHPDFFVIHEAGPLWENLLPELKNRYPHVQFGGHHGPTGIIIGSQSPGTFTEIPLGKDLALQFEPANGQTAILAVHPLPGMNRKMSENYHAYYQDLAPYLNAHPEKDWIVVGDFNATPWSPVIKSLLADTNLQDARIGFGKFPFFTPTWNAHLPIFKIPIDHALVSPGIQIHNFARLESTDSDHWGIWLEFD